MRLSVAPELKSRKPQRGQTARSDLVARVVATNTFWIGRRPCDHRCWRRRCGSKRHTGFSTPVDECGEYQPLAAILPTTVSTSRIAEHEQSRTRHCQLAAI